ncbi:MAG: ABC transporter ATP-binding protein [Acidimicrobiia bacterium]
MRLAVSGLTTDLWSESGPLRVVDEVDLQVDAGETLGVVGESGCGKSMTLMSILRLVAPHVGGVTGGRVELDGTDVLALGPDELRAVRGAGIALIPQDPMVALSPVLRLGTQMAAALRAHGPRTGRDELRRRSAELLEQVGVPRPDVQLRRYPHELSGGMLQRVAIAMAIGNGPRVVLADEPTTALDVTIQAQILELLADMQERNGMALVLVTHDLGVVSQVADRVNVMYAGRVVETASAADLFAAPRHPYTRALLASLPSTHRPGERLAHVEGQPPPLGRLPRGCAFEPRCAVGSGRDECLGGRPDLVPWGRGAVACHHAGEAEPPRHPVALGTGGAADG